METVLQIFNITVLEGHRTAEQQRKNFISGASKVEFSKHNEDPSEAVDIAPWPIPEDWGSPGPDHLYTEDEMKERAKFYYMAGVVHGVAFEQGVQIRWGGDWDNDKDFKDQKFDDLVHFEEAVA
jgi:peptidoglycan L-alanyl-D-glutamate endopeptidase CwlK